SVPVVRAVRGSGARADGRAAGMGLIETRYDRERGCGWRKEGGLYLVADGLSRACGKLPMPLTVCPTCHAGIKPVRSWTWIAARHLLGQQPCVNIESCGGCPLFELPEKAGLLWVGGAFYKTPRDWTTEAVR